MTILRIRAWKIVEKRKRDEEFPIYSDTIVEITEVALPVGIPDIDSLMSGSSVSQVRF